MRKVVFLGNCQANRYKELYAEKIAPLLGDQVWFVPSFSPADDDTRALLADADLVAAQVFDADATTGLHNLDTNAEVVYFPNATGMFLWPFGGDPHPLNKAETFLPTGPYDLNMGDRLLNRKLRGKTLSDAEILQIADEYIETDLSKAANAGRMYELVLDRQRQRDLKTGFACADLIERNLHDTAIFTTPSTFTLPLFRHLVEGLYSRMGVPATELERMLDRMLRSPFPATERPIHPSVVKFFDLRFVTPDRRYQSWTGEYLTLRDYVIRYLQYDWNEVLLRGCIQAEHMPRHADRSDVEAAFQLLRQGLARSPGSGRAERALSYLLSLLGDHEAAFAAYHRGITLEPDDPNAIGVYAHMLIERGEPDEAERVLRAATAQWPQSAQLWVRLGGMLAHQGLIRQAAVTMRQAVALHPDDANVCRFNAEIAARLANVACDSAEAAAVAEVENAKPIMLEPVPVQSDAHVSPESKWRVPGMLFSWLRRAQPRVDPRRPASPADMGENVRSTPPSSAPARVDPDIPARTVFDRLEPSVGTRAVTTTQDGESPAHFRLTDQISWMPSGRILTTDLGTNGGGTTSLTIGCSDDFVAVRLGFVNASRDPWTISKIVGCASSSFNDYVNPTGQTSWISFTAPASGEAATEIIVAANPPNQDTGALTWTWTDWAPIHSVDPDPQTGMRVLMLRGLLPSNQVVSFAQGQLRALTGNPALNRGFDCFVGGVKFNFDRLTDPSSSQHDETALWRDNQLVGGSLFPIVQFRTKNPGIVGVCTEELSQAGATDPDQVTNLLYRATTELGRRYVGAMPFGLVNGALGSLRSPQFLPRLEVLLRDIQPSFVILPGPDAADGPLIADRLLNAVKLCTEHGARAVFRSGHAPDDGVPPQDQFDPARIGSDIVLQMQAAGALVLRPPGETISRDDTPPPGAGPEAIAAELLALLQTSDA
jgi:tetratricopeptide (TPR) repeat protein